MNITLIAVAYVVGMALVVVGHVLSMLSARRDYDDRRASMRRTGIVVQVAGAVICVLMLSYVLVAAWLLGDVP